MSLPRKQQLYAIARRHNLIIMEDDPYYYLQFGNTRTPRYPPPPSPRH